MSKNLSGSKTEQILINSFAGEALARARYTYYSKVAKKEGYEQIAQIFLDTAANEQEHAKQLLKHLGSKTVGHVDSFYPFDFGTTEENLITAISGETEEAEILYKEGEKIAKEEGFEKIANTFHNIIIVEEHHAHRYKELLNNIKQGTVFSKDTDTTWICRKCGFIYHKKAAPEFCPNCSHPQAYFQILCEKY